MYFQKIEKMMSARFSQILIFGTKKVRKSVGEIFESGRNLHEPEK